MSPWLDYPMIGIALFALGSVGVYHRHALAPEDAVRLLVLADRFAYNRLQPDAVLGRRRGRAEEAAPGALAALAAEYGDRRGPDLHEEAGALLRPADSRSCREYDRTASGAKTATTTRAAEDAPSRPRR